MKFSIIEILFFLFLVFFTNGCGILWETDYNHFYVSFTVSDPDTIEDFEIWDANLKFWDSLLRSRSYGESTWISQPTVYSPEIFIATFVDSQLKDHSLILNSGFSDDYVKMDIWFLLEKSPVNNKYSLEMLTDEPTKINGWLDSKDPITVKILYQNSRLAPDDIPEYNYLCLTDIEDDFKTNYYLFGGVCNTRPPYWEKCTFSSPRNKKINWVNNDGIYDVPQLCSFELLLFDKIGRNVEFKTTNFRGNAFDEKEYVDNYGSNHIALDLEEERKNYGKNYKKDFLPKNFKGDIVVLIHREKTDYELRLFVGDYGMFRCFDDFDELLTELNEKYNKSEKIDITDWWYINDRMSYPASSRTLFGRCTAILCKNGE